MRKSAPFAAPAAEASATTSPTRPPHGGSFVRQADGSLKLAEGAVPAKQPGAIEQPADAGAPSTPEQHEA
jgi:hypothetical protein